MEEEKLYQEMREGYLGWSDARLYRLLAHECSLAPDGIYELTREKWQTIKESLFVGIDNLDLLHSNDYIQQRDRPEGGWTITIRR